MIDITDTYISPRNSLANNGIAVFSTLSQYEGFSTPMKLTRMLLVVCLRGEISAFIDLEPRRLQPSMMLTMMPGHTLNDVNQTEDFEGIFIVMDPERLNSVVPMSSTYITSCSYKFEQVPVVTLSPENLESIVALHSLLRTKSRTMSQPYNEAVFDALCKALFYDSLGIYTALLRKPTRVPTRREELLGRFIELVDRHFRAERSVAFYADELGLSPKHLSATIKKATGANASQWIDRKVVHEAKVMLRSSPRTIQQVSVELNFPNQSFFGKYFKHHTGLSPRQFRLETK